MAKSSSKRPSRVKPSAVKKSAASKAPSQAKKPPVKASRPIKKTPAIKPAVHAVFKNTSKTTGKPIGKPTSQPTGKPVVKPLSKPAKKTVVKKPVKALKAAPVKSVPVKPTSVQVVSVQKAKAKAVIPAPVAAVKKIAAKPVIAARATVAVKPISKAVSKTKPALIAKSARSSAPIQVKPEPFQAGPAVATNLKPRKSQIGLTVRELEHFADLLLAKRRELVGDMSSMEREALRSGSSTNLSTLPIHMADMGTDNFEQEFTLGLVEKDRNLLREINHALSKIQNGTYGICEGTGIAIGKARLEAAPWAKFSIEYARQKEKNGMGVRTL